MKLDIFSLFTSNSVSQLSKEEFQIDVELMLNNQNENEKSIIIRQLKIDEKNFTNVSSVFFQEFTV